MVLDYPREYVDSAYNRAVNHRVNREVTRETEIGTKTDTSRKRLICSQETL